MPGINEQDPSRIRFELEYSLWVPKADGTYKHLCRAPDAPYSVCIFRRDLPFERLKEGILRALGFDRDPDLGRLFKTAEGTRKIEWCFYRSLSLNGDQPSVVTDNESLKAFLAAEEHSPPDRRSLPPLRPRIEITMAKPEEPGNTGTSASSPANSNEPSGSQTNPSTLDEPTTPGEPESSSPRPNERSQTVPSTSASRPSKRMRPSPELPPQLDPDQLQMEDFLTICHIPPHDKNTRSVITIHRLHHWSVFNYLSVDELKAMGFSIGPALLINAGVDHVNRQVALQTAS